MKIVCWMSLLLGVGFVALAVYMRSAEVFSAIAAPAGIMIGVGLANVCGAFDD